MKRTRTLLTLITRLLLITLAGVALIPVPASASESVPAGAPTPLDVAAVDSPDINCLFAASCVWFVDWDYLDEVPLKGTNGLGRLQTRLNRQGESGTAAATLYPYLYGFNFFELEITTPPAECVSGFTIPFGTIAPADYDEDGEPDDLFVIQGGDAYLSQAVQLPSGEISITYATPICPGAPATANGSLFIGFASTQPSIAAQAIIRGSSGDSYAVDSLAPAAARIHLPIITRR